MKKKFLSICFLLVIITSLTIGIIFNKLMKDNYINLALETGLAQGNLINVFLTEHTNTELSLYRLAQYFGNKSEYRVTFIDEQGKALADSQDNSVIFENNNRFKLENGKNYPYYHIVKIGDVKILEIFTEAIEYDGKKIIPILSKELTYFNDFQKGIILTIIYGVLISGLLSLLMSYFVVGKTVKPIIELTKIAKNIAYGDLEGEVKIVSNDEIGELAKTFNFMSEKVKQLLKKIELKANELQNIIDNLQSAVFVIRRNGEIILINKFAIEELKIERKYNNIFEYQELEKLKLKIKKIIENNEELDTKIEFQEKIYRMKIRYILGEEEQVLITLQNITNIEMVEKLRREFVSNASHELKTPITVISGFIETIKLGHVKDEKQLFYFVDIMEKEIKRLGVLTDNLLQLSRTEKISEEKKEYKDLNLRKTLEAIIAIFSSIATRKKILVEKDIQIDTIKTTISEEWLRTVVGNLVDNAIKYSKDGTRVLIEASLINKRLIISIKDSGIGIPKEDIENIFRRFYRVDKSRNKKIEGNGLGLAIVKNMVSSINGKIEVESEVNNGTTMRLILPLI